jgi:hypothetical protein
LTPENTSLIHIEYKRRLLQDGLKNLEEEETEILKNKRFVCSSCSETVQLRDVERAYWLEHYIEPYGCSSGDYYENSNEVLIGCTKCDELKRCYANKPFSNDLILRDMHSSFMDFKRIFGDKVKTAYRGDWPKYELIVGN